MDKLQYLKAKERQHSSGRWATRALKGYRTRNKRFESDGMEGFFARIDKYVTEHNVIVWNPGEIGKLKQEEGECL